MGEAATWVYAVVPSTTADVPVDGVAGATVRTVKHRGLAAVVSSVAADEVAAKELQRRLADPGELEDLVRSHHQVIAETFQVAPTVPFRLGTVCADEQRVRDLLDQRYAQLSGALSAVTQRAEWGVRAYAVAPTPDGAEPAPAAAGDGRPGTAYLLRRRAERSQQAAASRMATRGAEELHASLAALSVAARRHPADGWQPEQEGRLLLNASFLVTDAGSDDFTAAARSLAGRHSALRVRVTGPWPAYSFVEDATEAG